MCVPLSRGARLRRQTDEDIAAVARWSLIRTDVRPPRKLEEGEAAQSLAELGPVDRVLLTVRDEDA